MDILLLSIALIAIAAFGFVLIFVGNYGIKLYGNKFLDDPQKMLALDMLLALLRGPGITPAVACIFLMIGGVFIVAIPISMAVMFAIELAG